MKKSHQWKLPLGLGDQIQLTLLTFFLKISWFSKILFIKHEYQWSPAYSIIINYLKKKRVIEDIFNEETRHSQFYSYFVRKKTIINGKEKKIIGYGTAENESKALSKALGEILERTLFQTDDTANEKNNVIDSPYNLIQKKQKIIYPPLYHHFLEIQKKTYPKLITDPLIPISFVNGINIITGEKYFIPRYLVFLNSVLPEVQRNYLYTTSNGCAGYFTKEGAILRGLLEIIQRDGFFVHWLTMTPPRLITQHSLPKLLQKIIEEFLSRGISLYILDVNSLGIPAVSIVGIYHQSEDSGVLLSGASDTSYEKAILDALTEINMLVTGLRYRKTDKTTEDPEPFISRIDKDHRPYYWRNTKIENMHWFLSGKKVDFNEIEKQYPHRENTNDTSKLKTCINILRTHGSDYHPIVYFSKDPLQTQLGFYCVKVFIPKAFPLYLNEFLGTFGSDRLNEFTQSIHKKKWTLNPFPHMFT